MRKFIAAIGLKKTRMPDSTRIFAAYLAGAPNYKTITWDELIALPPGPLAHPFLNDVETLASSPDDLVSFFLARIAGTVLFAPGNTGSVQKNSFARRHQLPGSFSHRVERLRQGGIRGHPRLTCSFHRRRRLLPKSLGLFLHGAELGCRTGRRPRTVNAFYRAIRTSIGSLQGCLSS